MSKRIAFPTWLLFFCVLFNAAGAQPTFQKKYGNSALAGYDLEMCSDGGYIISGATTAMSGDVYLVKINANGVAGWTRQVGGAPGDSQYGQAVAVASDGAFGVVGYTNGPGAGGNDIYFVKASSSGNLLWVKTLGGTGHDYAHSICRTTDDGFVIAGRTTGFGAGGMDAYIVKTNSDGVPLWSRTFGHTGSDEAFDIKQTNDGGFIVSGEIGMDMLLLKLASDGNLQWSKKYGTTGFEYGNSVQQTSDGGFILGGVTGLSGNFEAYLVKTGSDGVMEWSRSYGGSANDWIQSVIQSTDGGFVGCGYTNSFGAGGSDVFIIKTSTDGTMQWAKTYGTGINDEGQSIQQGADGGYYLLGSFAGMHLIKTDASGASGCNEIPTGLTNGSQGIESSPNLIQTSPVTVVGSGGTMTIPAATGSTLCASSSCSMTVSASPNTTICIGQSTSLSVSVTAAGFPPFTYSWSLPAGLSSTTVSNPVASPTVTTLYAVQVTDVFGCTKIATVNVTVANPAITIQGPTTVCNGSPVTLTATGATTYAWSNSQTTSTIVVSQIAPATYSVTGTIMTGCFGSANITLCGIFPSQKAFQRTYGGTGNNEEGMSAIQTSDGGYILCGYSNSFGNGSNDVLLSRLDSDGSVLWSKTYGGTADDVGSYVIPTNDGGYIIGGYSNSFGLGNFDIYLLKTNSTGSLLWSNVYGGSALDLIRAFDKTNDGGYMISGYTGSFGAGNFDMFLIKTNSNGNVLWSNTYGGTNFELGYVAAQTSDGGYMFTGQTSSYGAGDYDIYLVKTNSAGSLLWTKTYGGTAHDKGYSCYPTNDGGYLISGYTNSFGAGAFDLYLIKVDNLGSYQWAKTYGGTNNDFFIYSRKLAGDDLVLLGYAGSFSAGGDNDFYAIKTNSSGNLLWSRAYGNSGSERSQSVWPTSDNGFLFSGQSNGFSTGDQDIYLIKTDSDGNSGCNQVNLTSVMSASALEGPGGGQVGIWTLSSGTLGIETAVSVPQKLLCSSCTKPTVSVAQNTTFCAGSSATLGATASGATAPYTYNWVPANGLSNPAVSNPVASPSLSVTYTCFVADAVSCADKGTAQISVNPLPVVTFVLNPDTVCSGAAPYSLSGGLPAGGTYLGPGVSAGVFNPSLAGPGSHSLTYLYMDNNGCSDTMNVPVVVELCTGIAPVTVDRVPNVFPNPSSGVFVVEHAAGSLEVFNVFGEKVYRSKSHGSRHRIDLSARPAGIYFLQLSTGDEKMTVKILISH